ncbi:MAG: hypothetical protein J6B81_03410 [Spirochaetaceae bacterium]|nr:hypothetical protein [Spirochaetaceae bacterium]
MKVFAKAFFVLVGFVLLVGCASTPEPATSAAPPVSKRVEREMIDWKSASIGGEIPEWVYAAADNDQVALSALPQFEGKLIFFAEDQGKNLDLLKSWVNNFNVQAALSRQLSNFVIAKFGGEQSGDKNSEEVQMYLNELVSACSKAEINGLAKELDFWVKTRYADSDMDTIDDVYQYFVVYAMDKEDFRLQLDRALGKVEAKTQAQQEMKENVLSAVVEATIFAETAY